MAPPARYFASSAASSGDPSKLGVDTLHSYASPLSNTHPDSLLSSDEERAGDGGDGDNDEDDFMSDKFLASAQAADDKTKKTYSQMRREQLRKSQEKGHIKPRAEREREAREEGLRRNLLNPTSGSGTTEGGDAASGHGSSSGSTPAPSNKALEMMMKMGFKPGEALGKKTAPSAGSASTSRSASPASLGRRAQEGDDREDQEDDGFISLDGSSKTAGLGSSNARPGLGTKRTAASMGFREGPSSKQASEPAPTARPSTTKDDRRIDPIEIQMRTGRGGLGVEEAKRRKLASLVTDSAQRTQESASDYRSRTKDNFEERRAEGKLKGARKTLVELDTRHGVLRNYLWADPVEEQQRDGPAAGSLHDDRYTFASGKASKARLQRIGRFGEYESDEEGGDFGDDQHFTSRVSGAARTADEIRRGEAGDGTGGADDGGLLEEVYDEEEMRKYEDDKEEFFAKDARTRLAETVDYLRTKYFYCLWCGAQYDSKEELDNECPGAAEDEH